MKHMARDLANLLVVLISAVVGFGVGFRVASAIDAGIFVAWEPVPLPDGQQPARFLVGKGSSVYVEAIDGKLFTQHLDCSGKDTVWQVVEPADLKKDQVEYGYCSLENRHRRYLIRRPPGVVTEQLDCEVWCVEPIIAYRYAILDSGELWHWMKGSLNMGEVYLLYSLCYLCFTVGGAVLGRWVVKQWQKPHNHRCT